MQHKTKEKNNMNPIVKNSIRVVIISVAITILVMGTMVLSGYSYKKQGEPGSAGKNYSVIMSSTVENIDNWINNKMKILETAQIFVTDLDKKQVKNPLSKILKANKDLSEIYIGYEDGSFVDGLNLQLPKDYVAKTRPWYTGAKSAKKLCLTIPYLDIGTSEYFVTATYPITDSKGKLKGVIGEDIKLTKVIDIVKKLDLTDGDQVFLIDGSGQILSFNDVSLMIRNLWQKPDYQKLRSEIENKDSGIVTTTDQGQEHNIYYKKIPSTGWTLIINSK